MKRKSVPGLAVGPVIIFFTLVITGFFPLAISAKDKQNRQATPKPAAQQRVVQAVRAAESITIDGRLDEKIWQGAAAEGFTQEFMAQARLGLARPKLRAVTPWAPSAPTTK